MTGIVDRGDARILTIDIETAPHLAHVWGIFKQNVSLAQLRVPGKVICFAAKWYGKPRIMFHSDHQDGHEGMVAAAHALLSEADIVVHYNGTSFDLPHLRREILLAGLEPPSPVREVDLMRVVKSRFRFASNKLDHVTRELGLVGKVSHSGHELWVKCLEGDESAWRTMRRYNVNDVRITEQLYDRLRPWLKGHPHLGLWTGEDRCCPRCGSTHLQRRGWARTALTVYARYQCQGCGAWSRSQHRKGNVETREVQGG